MSNSVGNSQVLGVLQARMSSSRLPGKVLADILGLPMILRQIARIRKSRMIDRLVVATSTDRSDDELANVLRAAGVGVVRGSLDNVLDRFALAARSSDAQHLVRLTGDCPLTDPDIIDAVVAYHLVGGGDITSNASQPTFPDGLDVEVIRTEVLLIAAEKAQRKLEREHVTPYMYDQENGFEVQHYRGLRDLSDLRWTVDEQEDLEFVRAVYAALFPTTPCFRMHHVLELLTERPELCEINSQFTRNEGLARSIAEEGVPPIQGEV